MPKISSGLVAMCFAIGIVYLAFNPAAASAVWEWTSKQAGIERTEEKRMVTPVYIPVTPSKGIK
jgi:hypothetical protein